jgi:hypothetical protein
LKCWDREFPFLVPFYASISTLGPARILRGFSFGIPSTPIVVAHQLPAAHLKSTLRAADYPHDWEQWEKNLGIHWTGPEMLVRETTPSEPTKVTVTETAVVGAVRVCERVRLQRQALGKTQ